jgi:hypothetical protein
MDSRPVSRLAPCLLFAAAYSLSPPTLAQTSASSPSGFGTEDLQTVTLNHYAFQPRDSDQTFAATCCGADFYVHPTGGSQFLYAPLDAGLIPNGALLERVDFFVRDSTAESNIAGYLCRTWIQLDGSDLGSECFAAGLTSGTPGDTVIPVAPDATVLYETDADGDGDVDSVNYVLVAVFGTGLPDYTTDLRLRGARILYRRQVSPAPSNATFGDVPVGHPFFQFVEALAASGVTAGCGSGNYCPDAPLTRGQMAVFLAKALGLHWPGPEIP